ncbi:hypothetical protein J2S41_004281 [Catenuloplanes atrovinosus]|uniref:Uncharacterized protein n=1 Tax=Catenuloplanes atrovinosus TaxID=137266 RepID=A0AAE3YS94_9ACTN|nr:hypothetical protein [Catenuloplanes atrovinosus]
MENNLVWTVVVGIPDGAGAAGAPGGEGIPDGVALPA